jgi:hypothetical protein
MTVQTIKLAGKRFVILPEKDFQVLQRQAKNITPRRSSRQISRQAARDRADIEIAKRRLSDRHEKPIPYEQGRRELGLS